MNNLRNEWLCAACTRKHGHGHFHKSRKLLHDVFNSAGFFTGGALKYKGCFVCGTGHTGGLDYVGVTALIGEIRDAVHEQLQAQETKSTT